MDAMGLVALAIIVEVEVADPGERCFEARALVVVRDFSLALWILSKKDFISWKSE